MVPDYSLWLPFKFGGFIIENLCTTLPYYGLEEGNLGFNLLTVALLAKAFPTADLLTVTLFTVALLTVAQLMYS